MRQGESGNPNQKQGGANDRSTIHGDVLPRYFL
jgi:hypothetical protein